MGRQRVAADTEAKVLMMSKRWCALCYGLKNLREEKRGQIAHINKDSSDSRFENLVFLCIDHHDQYDSTTSQSKNYTQAEVRRYRDQIYAYNSNQQYSNSEIEVLRKYIRTYSGLFEYLFNEYDDIALMLQTNILEIIGHLRNTWSTNPLRSFNPEIQHLQDLIANSISDIRAIYEIRMYDGVGTYIRYDTENFGRAVLAEKRQLAKNYIDQIAHHYHQLKNIASAHS